MPDTEPKMTSNRIAELCALIKGATPSVWKVEVCPRDGWEIVMVFAHDGTLAEGCTYTVCEVGMLDPERKAERQDVYKDAAFIAAARTALPAALDALEGVRALCDDPFMVPAGEDGIANASRTRRAFGTVPMVTVQDILAALEGKE